MIAALQPVVDAFDDFRDYVDHIKPVPLAAAIGCQLLKVACTSRAWRNVLSASYPQTTVRWRSIYAAYLAGAGINAIFPARLGDLARLVIARRSIPQSTYATVFSSTFVLSIIDAAAAISLFAWALTNHVLPGFDILRRLPSVDYRWFLVHGRATLLIAAGVIVCIGVLALFARARLREISDHVAQGFSILHTPFRYLRTVATWQVAGWGLRLATVWFFLGAFGIHQSVHNMLTVQATATLATLAPISPGGIGTSQALLVYTLRGQATRTAVLAFSVGMEITLTAVDLIVGFAAILIVFRTFRFRKHLTRHGRRIDRPSEATHDDP
jgi:uncharacterized membrane protein YbhN (UPF0104 family)